MMDFFMNFESQTIHIHTRPLYTTFGNAFCIYINCTCNVRSYMYLSDHVLTCSIVVQIT